MKINKKQKTIMRIFGTVLFAIALILILDLAFNGSKNFPKKAMLDYLQTKGIRFGADINAYTAFDETVYNIDNIPTSDVALMDSVLLMLHDWSCALSLEEAEIDAERGGDEGMFGSRIR